MINERIIGEMNIPTLDEMQSLYERALREEALISLEEQKISKEEKVSFFDKFRKSEIENYKMIEDSEINNIYYKKYKNYIEKEIKNKGDDIEKIENLIKYERFYLNFERKLSIKNNNSNNYESSPATRYRIDQINSLENKLRSFINESPEAWQFYYKRKLMDDIENHNNQNLIMVPYVFNSKQKIIDSLDLGIPVYIVGHLGSGKTQLASEAALSFNIKNKIQSDLEHKMEDWFSINQNAEEKDVIEKFTEFYKEREKYYKNILIRGKKDEIDSLQPLFISGSHNLTYEDMFVEKTLYLKHSFSNGSYKDYLNIIIEDYYKWLNDHKERLNKMTEIEQLNLKIQIWKSFSDLLVANNSAFGTEVKKIEREVLIAVREGRTVIIDELNTIAMQNLISLNDILQRHSGDTAYITGVGPVLIKSGFGFIGTGNLSTQMVNYEGTNELNPAFKSRFVTIEYNYLPQKVTGSLENQNLIEESELFRVIITRLADKKGNIFIPNSKKTLEELFRFCQLSKITQNVFMNKWKDNEIQSDIGAEEPELRESVLSIRNILHVLDTWNKGEEKDLSKSLWDGFISSITYPDDQNYILAQAVRFGFFPRDEGWDIKTKGLGESTTSYDEIRTYPYKYVRESIDVLSYLDVMHLVFGEGSRRKKIPQSLIEDFKYDAYNSSQIDVDKYQKLDQQLSHLEHTKNLIDYLENNGENNGE